MANVKTTILHIVRNLDTGGLERLVVDIVKGMDRNKYRPILCHLQNEKSKIMDKALKESKIEIATVSKSGKGIDVGALRRLIRLLRKENVKIVHTHNAMSLLYGSFAAWIAQVPVIIHTKHGDGLPDGGLTSVLANRIAASFNSRFIAVSENTKKAIMTAYSAAPKKIVIIRNGIDLCIYKSLQDSHNIDTKRRELGLKQEDFIVGIVARLSHEKDHHTLLKAISVIKNRFNDNIKLLVVGDGVLRDNLKKEVHDLGISNNALFVGDRDDVPDILNVIDVFVLSSISEGLSLTLLEAMAVEKPVVATNVGGNSEVVVDGVTGILAPPQDPKKMAEAIIKILRDPKLAKKMGEAGRKRVEEKFSLNKMVREYEAVYEECLAKSKLGHRS